MSRPYRLSVKRKYLIEKNICFDNLINFCTSNVSANFIWRHWGLNINSASINIILCKFIIFMFLLLLSCHLFNFDDFLKFLTLFTKSLSTPLFRSNGYSIISSFCKFIRKSKYLFNRGDVIISKIRSNIFRCLYLFCPFLSTIQ